MEREERRDEGNERYLDKWLEEERLLEKEDHGGRDFEDEERRMVGVE